jgi:Fe2+ transport system protein FeoA
MLSTTKAGETVRLVRIDAGRGLNSRLAAMGLVAGAELRVVSNGHPGPTFSSSRRPGCFGRGVAQKIWVE